MLLHIRATNAIAHNLDGNEEDCDFGPSASLGYKWRTAGRPIKRLGYFLVVAEQHHDRALGYPFLEVGRALLISTIPRLHKTFSVRTKDTSQTTIALLRCHRIYGETY